MKTLKAKFSTSESWNKRDERLLQAVEQDEPEKVAALLMKKGLCPSKLDSEGKSAFHVSVSRGHVDCLEVILSHGVDISLKDSKGFSALHLAAKNGHVQCLKRLLQEQMNVDSTDRFGRTCLHFAALSGSMSCAEILWDFKANLNIQDKDGATPLILAAQMNWNEVCVFLLNRGADPNIQDNQGRSALMLAHENDSWETVEVLLKSGANPKLSNDLGHNASHTAAGETSKEMPSTLPGVSTARKRKAPAPPKSPQQAEDEEVYEEIRRLRLERGRLLQKVKALEQQQSSATIALKEVSSLRQHLIEAEAERDCLQLALEELKVQHCGAACDLRKTSDNTLDLPAETWGQPEDTEARQLNSMERLCRQVEELTAQNAELLLKVQMLELFEKDDTDMQSSTLAFVSMSTYDSLRREFEQLQEKYISAQNSTEGLAIAKNFPGSENKPKKTVYAESKEEVSEGEEVMDAIKQKSLKEQLANAYTELEELRKQIQLSAGTMEFAELVTSKYSGTEKYWLNSNTQELTASVKELGPELANRLNEHNSNIIRHLKQRVEEQEETLQVKEKEVQVERKLVKGLKERIRELEEIMEQTTGKRCSAEGEEDTISKLQSQVAELEAELRQSIPYDEFNKMQLNLDLQLKKLTHERNEVVLQLSQTLMDLERFRSSTEIVTEKEKENDNKLEHFDVFDPASVSGKYICLLYITNTILIFASPQEHLEVASQQAVRALICSCSERECFGDNVLQLRNAIPLAKHEKELSTIAEELAQTEIKLQAERALKDHIQAKMAQLESELQASQHDMISKEEHEKIRVELQRCLEDCQISVAAAHKTISEKDLELKELSQKAIKLDMVSKEDHEAQQLSLQAEINALTGRLADLTRKHEKTCTEVFQVQREALFNKSERQAAEAQLLVIQQQLADLQAQSTHIQQLHQNIQHSQGLIKEKDHKITELSKDVFRLKEALGALSPPVDQSTSTLSPGIPGQQLALQNRVFALIQQIQDWELKHKSVVAVYRSHLLAAAQGRMDEEVQMLLLQILRMTQNDQSN
ncbi:ankyrin repeat domain-containing protein 24 [Trichomycterus rosablanca]|uniref:ankyrin repeat domain-containing protein 24 n=1 Tax=Trichomycterus rosablanca TaxID=2290929 RepID=UPI002F35925B